MAAKLCACLLNVSEARNRALVEKIAKSALRINDGKAQNVPLKSAVLNIFSDQDYNRSVITIVSTAEHIKTSVSAACITAFRSIDLSTHSGGHPRLGAVDLVPIHPISGTVSLQECGQIARDIATSVCDEVPGASFFLFGEADHPHHRGLVHRRKEVKWFKGKLGSSYEGIPYDIGGVPSSKLGLTGIGAIPYVMNCNVIIDTDDVAFGRQIAAAIRGSTPGGLPGVQSMAFAHEGKVEIACNVQALQVDPAQDTSDVDLPFKKTKQDMICSFGTYYNVAPKVVEDRVRDMASKQGIETVGTSIVGFTPQEAQNLTLQVLSDGPAEFWRTRHSRQM